MVSMTLSIPEDIKRKMENFPEMNWSGFVRKCIESKVDKLTWKEQMLKQLESEAVSDELALKIGDKIKTKAWERLKKEGW